MSWLLLGLLRPGGLLDLRTDVERYALDAAPRLEEVGFVHTSFAQQVGLVAAAGYDRVDAPLVLLVLDRARLGCPVRVEPVHGVDEVFPHVYGPLPLAAVADVVELRRDVVGRLVLPAL